MEPVLDDIGPDLGEFGDLVPGRRRVVAPEVVAAAATGRRATLDEAGQPLGCVSPWGVLDGNLMVLTPLRTCY
jgi:hypothetical protein